MAKKMDEKMEEKMNRIAVVDIQRIVTQSKQVNALKEEQQSRITELNQWLAQVRDDVQKQADQETRQKLVDEYNKVFVAKQNEIKANYAEKLKAIETSINTTISTEAQNRGYDMVLSKYIVLFGGEDLTEELAKVVE